MQKNNQKAYILLETIISLVIISISFLTLTIFSTQIYKNIIFYEEQKSIDFVKQKLDELLNSSLSMGEFTYSDYAVNVKRVVKFDEELFEVTVTSNGIKLVAYSTIN